MNKDKKSLQIMSLSAFALIGFFGSEGMAVDKGMAADKNECYKECIQANPVTIDACGLSGSKGREYIQCVNHLNNCIEIQKKCPK